MAQIALSDLCSSPHVEWGRRNLPDAMKRSGIPAMGLCVLDQGTLSVHTIGCTPCDLFQVSALSQMVFSILVLRLAEEKRMDLHADITRFGIASRVPAHPRFKGSITLAQLLSHSAGLGLPFFPGYAAGTPLPSTEQSLMGERPASNAPLTRIADSGTQALYSSGGYLLAQAVVEERLGESLESLARQYVFEPLGMQHSTFAPEPDGSLLPGHGHFRRQIKGGYLRHPEGAACGLWSCARDMGRLLEALGKQSPLLSPALRERLIKPYHKSNFSLGMSCDSAAPDKPFAQAGGGSSGYQAKVRFFPEDDRGFVLLANSHTAFRVMLQTQYVLYQALSWPYMPQPNEPKRRPYTHADQI